MLDDEAISQSRSLVRHPTTSAKRPSQTIAAPCPQAISRGKAVDWYGGVQGNEFCDKLHIRVVIVAETGEFRSLQDGNSEHFSSGAGCSEVVHVP